MAELRPRGMSQGELAELLREHGFSACSKAAVSLAERPKDSGVQFTPEARNAVRGALKSTSRPENRKHGSKTTVWFDEETRAWLETQAYLTDTNVGEIVRRIVAEARRQNEFRERLEKELQEYDKGFRAFMYGQKEKAASDVGASEAAGRK